VKKAMQDMADELVKLYAQRKMVQGHSFPTDTEWMKEFEDAFEYNETDDQMMAIGDVKRDMESGQPMDRLLCGDVGYGKTEVANARGFSRPSAITSRSPCLPPRRFSHFNITKRSGSAWLRFQSASI